MSEQLIIAIVSGALGGSAIAALINQIGETIREREKRKHSAEDSENEELRAIKAGLKNIMLDRIRYVGQSYIRGGSIDFDDRRILNDMHKSYHDLGGNGDLDLLMKSVNELPLKAERK